MTTLTQADHAWLLNEAAFSLRALGRLTEGLEPMRAALEMGIKQEDWINAAINASNAPFAPQFEEFKLAKAAQEPAAPAR